MPKQEQVKAKKSSASRSTTQERIEAPAEVDSAPSKRKAAETKLEAIDELLDEIDEVLEENAEDFVRAYIQKGGQ